MIPIEVVRILRGSLNKGLNGSYLLYPNYNYDAIAPDNLNAIYSQSIDFIPDLFSPTLNPSSRYKLDNKGVIPFSALSTVPGVNNFPIQDKYLWPWSHAAFLFGLLVNFNFLH